MNRSNYQKQEETENYSKKKCKEISHHTHQKVQRNCIDCEKLDLLRSALKGNSPACRTALEKAKQISKRMHSIKENLHRLHKNRIDLLLASNELKRVPIKTDGNCFLEPLHTV